MPQSPHFLLTSSNPELFTNPVSSLLSSKYAYPCLSQEAGVETNLSWYDWPTILYQQAIQSPSGFRQRAVRQKTFNQLYQDGEWTSGVSGWGRQELFAARVICPKPATDITPLIEFYPDSSNALGRPFMQFINGPPNMNGLSQSWEPELVRGTNPECLGGTRPPMIWRDDSPLYSLNGGNTGQIVSAADYGGIQRWDPTRQVFRQVALLEGKRILKIENGEPVVTDEVLAQMVGEALALRRSNNSLYTAGSSKWSITILATAYFVRIYAFEFPESYGVNYEDLAMTAHGCHLLAHSIKWLNIQRDVDREMIVKQLLAVIAWGSSL